MSREVSQEIHNKAEPFIKWLKEADTEESSESEEESDDEVEIEYNDRAQMSPLKATQQAPAAKKPVQDDDGEDDVDIDAI